MKVAIGSKKLVAKDLTHHQGNNADVVTGYCARRSLQPVSIPDYE